MSTIKHVTQLNNPLVNDCGQACATMLINAYQGRALTVEQVARATGTDKGKFTPFYPFVIRNPDGSVKERRPGLIDILYHYGLKASYTNAATWEWYLRKFAEAVPVIALVAYKSYGDMGHFMVITGASNGMVTVFDPLTDSGPTFWTEAAFKRAISVRSTYAGGTNNPHQAMYATTPLSAPIPLFANAIDAVASRVRLEATG
jgi:ABC-type bacteriocin/lantibiotic exporter with double-glycine peptidase domain